MTPIKSDRIHKFVRDYIKKAGIKLSNDGDDSSLSPEDIKIAYKNSRKNVDFLWMKKQEFNIRLIRLFNYLYNVDEKTARDFESELLSVCKKDKDLKDIKDFIEKSPYKLDNINGGHLLAKHDIKFVIGEEISSDMVERANLKFEETSDGGIKLSGKEIFLFGKNFCYIFNKTKLSKLKSIIIQWGTKDEHNNLDVIAVFYAGKGFPAYSIKIDR